MKIQRIQSRVRHFKVMMLALLISMFSSILFADPAHAVGSYSNASIADIALTKLGQHGGQCKTFANNIISQASGGTQWPAPGYHSGFANAGGVQVTSSQATKGDIIQIGNSDYDNPLHTAIIVENKGNGNFNVVDSNWGLDEIVKQHDFNPYSWALGSDVRIWRMGTVIAPSDNNDIAWWSGSTLRMLRGTNFDTSSIQDGLQPGDWHGILDYDNDGQDDIVLYRQSDQSLRVLLKNPSGGYSPYPENPVRTGLPAPTWAGVGDFDKDGKKDDITWWSGNTVRMLTGAGFHTSSISDGFSPGDWHDVMDYDNDGYDDIVFYRQNDQSLRVLRKSPTGGYTGHAGNPIRTGLGSPTWAGVGDLDGDGKKNDIHWWQGNTVFVLIHPNFHTSSYSTGFAPGIWHGVLDYNTDGRDDIVFYRQGDQSLRVLLKSGGGGYTGNPTNPLRTNLPFPTWAGVGNFMG